jgi:hypothetical protein
MKMKEKEKDLLYDSQGEREREKERCVQKKDLRAYTRPGGREGGREDK